MGAYSGYTGNRLLAICAEDSVQAAKIGIPRFNTLGQIIVEPTAAFLQFFPVFATAACDMVNGKEFENINTAVRAGAFAPEKFKDKNPYPFTPIARGSTFSNLPLL